MSEWRPVPGYEGVYEVSDGGEVRSMPRPRTRGGLLSQKLAHQRGGYPTVSLVSEGRQATRTVHTLVAEAFLGSRPDGMEVRHLDGDPTNSALSNLAYGTRSENVRDMRRHGTDHNAAKTHCPVGHPYDDANTYVAPSRPTARYCRACTEARRHPDYRQEWRP